MDLTKFAVDVHKNAVEHGWWEEERDFASIISLCHSEISEALEEYRAGRPMVYGSDFQSECRVTKIPDIMAREMKPEGIATELADCIIRILDWFGKNGIDAECEVNAGKLLRKVAFQRDTEFGFGGLLADLHLCLSMAYRNWKNVQDLNDANHHLGLCITLIFEWAEVNGQDMDSILRMKHEYNIGRPYRHGGKLM